MPRDLRVHLLPKLFEPDELRGGVAVILDVLRASTTIIHALAHGAECVVPTEEIDEALAVKATLPAGTVLLGGERDGLLIPGFDLDNNPFVYSEAVVRGKTIVFTTTNGTQALRRALTADRVLIGSFVNLSAVVYKLLADDRPMHIICAGTMGKITLEDVICAGAICNQLEGYFEDLLPEDQSDFSDDQVQIALDHYWFRKNSPGGIIGAMREGAGGRNCRRLGFDDQIARAATIDLFDCVPEYDAATERIVCAR